MTRLVRLVGCLMIGAGALVLLAWAAPPLKALWPWLLKLPWPVRLGLGVAAGGLVLLVATVVWERLEDRAGDRDLLDDP